MSLIDLIVGELERINAALMSDNEELMEGSNGHSDQRAVEILGTPMDTNMDQRRIHPVTIYGPMRDQIYRISSLSRSTTWNELKNKAARQFGLTASDYEFLDIRHRFYSGDDNVNNSVFGHYNLNLVTKNNTPHGIPLSFNMATANRNHRTREKSRQRRSATNTSESQPMESN